VVELSVADVGLGLLLPAALAAEAVAANPRSRFQPWRGAVGLLVAFAAAYFTLELGPARPERAGSRWLPHLLVLAIPAGIIAARTRPWWFIATALALTGAAAGPLIVRDWWGMAAFWSVALGYVVLASAGGVLATRWPAAALAAAVGAMSAVAGYVLMEAALPRMAQIAGILGATAGGACLASLLPGRDPEGRAVRAMIPGFMVFLAALMFLAKVETYANVPPHVFAAVALAPAVLVLRRLHPFASVAGFLAILGYAAARTALA